ncbi:hypothetical protein RSAG8_12928, partial [Rhizoctonia solani AG-8 WAC10335]
MVYGNSPKPDSADVGEWPSHYRWACAWVNRRGGPRRIAVYGWKAAPTKRQSSQDLPGWSQVFLTRFPYSLRASCSATNPPEQSGAPT